MRQEQQQDEGETTLGKARQYSRRFSRNAGPLSKLSEEDQGAPEAEHRQQHSSNYFPCRLFSYHAAIAVLRASAGPAFHWPTNTALKSKQQAHNTA